jgi:hypothetical protein
MDGTGGPMDWFVMKRMLILLGAGVLLITAGCATNNRHDMYVGAADDPSFEGTGSGKSTARFDRAGEDTYWSATFDHPDRYR